MLIFFVLCAFLHSLQGASVLLPLDALGLVSPTKTSTLVGREYSAAPDDGGQQLRTVYSIVHSCLLTIFACVWKPAHPNIDDPRDSGWTCMKRRLITTLWAVIAPEVVLFWAFRQYFAAKQIAKEYNKEFARSDEAERSLWEKTVGWFEPAPEVTTWRGNGQSWTTAHGFFIQMGGFMLYEDEYPKEVLDYERLAQLLRNKAIDPIMVTERDLEDRSKGDTISKAVVMLQTSQFVTQCIVRMVQHLPLSELEVLTLAFAVMNAAIYAMWWNKPQGVEMAICIPLKRIEEEVDRSMTCSTSEVSCEPGDPELAALPQSPHRHSNVNLPLIPPLNPDQQADEHVEETRTWLWRVVQKDRQNHSLPYFLFVCLPYRISIFVLRPAGKMATPLKFKRKTHLHTPMFYSVDVDGDEGKNVYSGQIYAMSIITAVFGATHLISWASEFQSTRDLVLWRISAIVATVNPVLLLGALPAVLDMDTTRKGLTMPLLSLIPLYIASRFALFIIALKDSWNPTPGVLLNTSSPWTVYTQHVCF